MVLEVGKVLDKEASLGKCWLSGACIFQDRSVVFIHAMHVCMYLCVWREVCRQRQCERKNAIKCILGTEKESSKNAGRAKLPR